WIFQRFALMCFSPECSVWNFSFSLCHFAMAESYLPSLCNCFRWIEEHSNEQQTLSFAGEALNGFPHTGQMR
ncbi:hypothetical protein, partial [Eisenbergiella porci]|uniref:hypothetical protein n=1 Tax=Eisenbergiella porci TaxID=2652274 RepID=UPI001F1E6EB3